MPAASSSCWRLQGGGRNRLRTITYIRYKTTLNLLSVPYTWHWEKNAVYILTINNYWKKRKHADISYQWTCMWQFTKAEHRPTSNVRHAPNWIGVNIFSKCILCNIIFFLGSDVYLLQTQNLFFTEFINNTYIIAHKW
jgi:hypothetical protein